jgi:hypothetical protein
MSTLRLSERGGPRGRQAWVSAALAATIGCWAAVMVAWFLDVITLPLSGSGVDALLVTPPLVLATTWALSSRPATAMLRYATGLTAVLAAILLLTPQVIGDQTLALGLPGLLLATWVVWKRPALGTVVVLAITGTFGSLSAYLTFPYYRTMTLTLAALLSAAVIRLLIARRRGTLRLPLSVTAILGYLLISLAQLALAGNRQTALHGFELAPWAMCAMLAVAYSQWSRETHARILRALLLIAVGVGGYAVLRLIIGPSTVEREMASSGGALAIYNFADGHLKLLGSFPNGADLAHWTGLMLPFCVSAALGLRGRARRLAIVAVPLLAVALLGAQSRASGLAALVAALLVVTLHIGARAFVGLRLEYALIAVLTLVIVGGGAYVAAGGASSQANSGHSYASLLAGPSHDASFADHEYKLNQAFRDLAGHPFGYGLGTANPGFNPPSVAPVPPSSINQITGFVVDNGYLKVALEQGFAIMVLFAVGLVLLAGTFVRGGLRIRDPMRATIVIGSFGVLVSLLLMEMGAAVADGIPAVAGWIVMGLGLAQCVQRETPAGQTVDS